MVPGLNVQIEPAVFQSSFTDGPFVIYKLTATFRGRPVVFFNGSRELAVPFAGMLDALILEMANWSSDELAQHDG